MHAVCSMESPLYYSVVNTSFDFLIIVFKTTCVFMLHIRVWKCSDDIYLVILLFHAWVCLIGS